MKIKPSKEDVKVLMDIKFSGTRKTKYKDNIKELFLKYINNNVPICGTCPTEMGAVCKKLLYYFDEYIKNKYIEKMNAGRPHKLILNDLGIDQRLIDSYIQDRKDKRFKESLLQK